MNHRRLTSTFLVVMLATLTSCSATSSTGTEPIHTTPDSDNTPLDGPVIRYLGPAAADSEALAGEIEGELLIDGDCIYVANGAAHPLPVLWPHGTGWDESEGAVRLPGGALLRQGDFFSASGGYTSVGAVGRIAGSDANQLVNDCIGDSPDRQLAMISNGTQIITTTADS